MGADRGLTILQDLTFPPGIRWSSWPEFTKHVGQIKGFLIINCSFLHGQLEMSIVKLRMYNIYTLVN